MPGPDGVSGDGVSVLTGTAPDGAGNRVAVLTGTGRVELQRREVPAPGPGEVLVAVRCVGVCGSDVHYFQHGRIGSFVVEGPLVLGHEASGVIAGVGEGVAGSLTGTRVAIEPGIPCGRCSQCLAGRYNLCPDVRFFATPPVDGAFADYVTVPAAFAHPLPDSISDEAGALIEPLAVAVAANRKARVQPGDRVLVTGAGPVGQLCALVARRQGASAVTVVDISPQRLELARSAGLDAVDGRAPWADGATQFDVLVECSGSAPVLADALGALAPAGRAVLVGMSGSDEPTPVPAAVVLTRELNIQGLFRYANCHPAAIALAASGAVDLDRLVSHRYPLEDVQQALLTAAAGGATMKVLVNVAAG